MTAYQAAHEVLETMGGNAQDICSGDCGEFATRMIDLLGRGQIVACNMVAYEDDFSGYDVIAPEMRVTKNTPPHCWVKVDGKYYDAFDPQGVEEECNMEWIENI